MHSVSLEIYVSFFYWFRFDAVLLSVQAAALEQRFSSQVNNEGFTVLDSSLCCCDEG